MTCAAARSRGKAYLVGAGPGPVDLLTLRAHRCLREAEVLIHDRLVGTDVLNLVPQDCKRIDVGKASGHHLLPQENINALIVDHVLAGKKVVRLKGGDPGIFGRVAEEMTALRAASIDYEVIPGITAASSCAAAAGFSLTHRDMSHSCVFLTGHGAHARHEYGWEALAHPRQTRVFYMGVERLQLIGEKLIAHGLSPTTPAALIFAGQSENQQIFASTLADLMKRDPRYQRIPGLLVIGETVALSPFYGAPSP